MPGRTARLEGRVTIMKLMRTCLCHKIGRVFIRGHLFDFRDAKFGDFTGPVKVNGELISRRDAAILINSFKLEKGIVMYPEHGQSEDGWWTWNRLP